MKGKLSVLINKDSDGDRKKIILKIKSFAKNTNIKEDEKISSFDDIFADKSLNDSSEQVDNTFSGENYTIDNSDEIHSDEASDEAYEDICSNGDVSESYDSHNNDSDGNDDVFEEYEEIYSHSNRNVSYLDDRDFEKDIELIIAGLDLNPESDISFEENVDGILQDADTDFEAGTDFEEDVRQVFRSMRDENDIDEEDIDLILESVSIKDESENEEAYDVIDINEDLDILLADIRSYSEVEDNKDNNKAHQKKTSLPSKRERIYYDDDLNDGNYQRDKKNGKNDEKKEEENEKPRRRIISYEVLKKMVFWLITVAALTVLLTMLFMPVLQIYGTSMSPLLEEGDILLTFRTSDFKKGDIISFYYNNKILVKRVVAFEGDYVNIESDGSVYVNNKKLEEDYVSEKAFGECDITLPYQVPSGKIFVLGDHRLTSVDSRNKAMGCVSQEQISGKPVFRVWPLNRMGFVEN